MTHRLDLEAIKERLKERYRSVEYGEEIEDIRALLARVEALEAAMRAITIRMDSGEVCFRTANGVPMEMEPRLERIARKALEGEA